MCVTQSLFCVNDRLQWEHLNGRSPGKRFKCIVIYLYIVNIPSFPNNSLTRVCSSMIFQCGQCTKAHRAMLASIWTFTGVYSLVFSHWGRCGESWAANITNKWMLSSVLSVNRMAFNCLKVHVDNWKWSPSHLSCVSNSPLLTNAWPQTLHLNGFILLCRIKCCFKLAFCVKPLPQTEQRYGRSPEWVRMWSFRVDDIPNAVQKLKYGFIFPQRKKLPVLTFRANIAFEFSRLRMHCPHMLVIVVLFLIHEYKIAQCTFQFRFHCVLFHVCRQIFFFCENPFANIALEWFLHAFSWIEVDIQWQFLGKSGIAVSAMEFLVVVIGMVFGFRCMDRVLSLIYRFQLIVIVIGNLFIHIWFAIVVQHFKRLFNHMEFRKMCVENVLACKIQWANFTCIFAIRSRLHCLIDAMDFLVCDICVGIEVHVTVSTVECIVLIDQVFLEGFVGQKGGRTTAALINQTGICGYMIGLSRIFRKKDYHVFLSRRLDDGLCDWCSTGYKSLCWWLMDIWFWRFQIQSQCVFGAFAFLLERIGPV